MTFFLYLSPLPLLRDVLLSHSQETKSSCIQSKYWSSNFPMPVYGDDGVACATLQLSAHSWGHKGREHKGGKDVRSSFWTVLNSPTFQKKRNYWSGSILPQKRMSNEKDKKGGFRVESYFLNRRKMGWGSPLETPFPSYFCRYSQQKYRASIQAGVAITKKIFLNLAEEDGIVR